MTMNSLLNNMVVMTGHRDHAMLDISVISAVQELAAAAQTRILTMSTVEHRVFLHPRASIKAGSSARTEDNPDATEDMSDYPALAACIARREASVAVIGPDGRHLLWLPIWIGDKAGSCIEVVKETPYSSATLDVIHGVVSVYRNFQNLLDYSERDSLTGLLNRKTFDDQLARMLQANNALDARPSASRQERRHLSELETRIETELEKQWLAVIDVDHFKLVNDRFGHLYGDEVLILIANLLQSTFRAQDRVFRFGGEEFVVLLRSCTLANASRIIDRFRTNVASHRFPQVGAVTVSSGFASIGAGESPVTILGRADQALYYAKSHGRNQTCHYDQLLSSGLLHRVESGNTAEFF
jgi:diguanylate cyclase (GGDEF)-like protein